MILGEWILLAGLSHLRDQVLNTIHNSFNVLDVVIGREIKWGSEPD